MRFMMLWSKGMLSSVRPQANVCSVILRSNATVFIAQNQRMFESIQEY